MAATLAPVTRAQDEARCSCASFVAAYALRGSSGADSSTSSGPRSRPQDGQGGSAEQTYQVQVGNEPGNTPPVFVSQPPTQESLPEPSNPPVGVVDPTSVDLNLGRGDSATTTVSATIPTTGSVPRADVFLLLDDTASFSDWGPILTGQFPLLISQLQAALPGVNFASIIGMLQSIQLEDKGNDAHVRVLVPDDALLVVVAGFTMPMRVMRQAPARAVPAPAAPPAKDEKKE